MKASTRGRQKNQTEPNQTEPTEPKPIQTELKFISNHSVKNFSNPNGSVLNRTEPKNRFIFVIIEIKNISNTNILKF